MSNVRISELNEANSINDDDLLMIVQNEENKKAKVKNLPNFLKLRELASRTNFNTVIIPNGQYHDMDFSYTYGVASFHAQSDLFEVGMTWLCTINNMWAGTKNKLSELTYNPSEKEYTVEDLNPAVVRFTNNTGNDVELSYGKISLA